MRAHREELQRVQIGLVGLAAVLLIVTLANLVIQTARTEASAEATAAAIQQGIDGITNATASQQAATPSANEPLADLGVTPTADTATPSVPDLEPDPRLRKPMDRDPHSSSSSR